MNHIFIKFILGFIKTVLRSIDNRLNSKFFMSEFFDAVRMGDLNKIDESIQKRGIKADCLDNIASIGCAMTGRLDVLKHLVKHGANPKQYDNLSLEFAASNGHLEVVQYLVIECGCDLGQLIQNGEHRQNIHPHIAEWYRSYQQSISTAHKLSKTLVPVRPNIGTETRVKI